MWENTAPRSASFVPGSVCFSSALCLYVHGVGVHIVSESDVAQFHSIYSTALFLHQEAARLDAAPSHEIRLPVGCRLDFIDLTGFVTS